MEAIYRLHSSDHFMSMRGHNICFNHEKANDNPISTSFAESNFHAKGKISEDEIRYKDAYNWAYMFKKGKYYYINGYDFRIITKDKSKVDEILNNVN